ncbi:MAG: 4-(cytidine 5'-diphospho)-2-C-methyl-D-erythritol kinase [Treponema sp.]|jgi:4-diphosphocytidyl-2-C-methyl-D-erythritol kinase|nr:4-(cytidine 5'-diphospho)-2-C-methyl-D-erythritol kinase [Treponema sp.]
MKRSCSIQAPAKINLHLQVGDRRADGFHDLESIVLSLAFGDTLRFELDEAGAGTPDGGITMIGAPAGACGPIPADQNSIARALALFKARTGFDKPLRICLYKRIPLGGGLGGGSSDAASTLLALDALAGTRLSREVLASMAASLGSDVPFFLTGGAAWVRGRGEVIEPLPMPGPYWILLVNPGFPSGTGEAFDSLDAFRSASQEPKDGGKGAPRGDLLRALAGSPDSWPYRNDFLPVFLQTGARERREAYRRMLADLAALGAAFQGLSGAGSTCFGVFTQKGAAAAAVHGLAERWMFARVTFFLARSAHAVVQYD